MASDSQTPHNVATFAVSGWAVVPENADVKPPRKPARWTLRLPPDVWFVVVATALGALGWYTVSEKDGSGRCRVCLREGALEGTGLDLWGKLDVPLWEDVDWGPSTRIETELLGSGHEHEIVYSRYSQSSRFGFVGGCGFLSTAPLAKYFEFDAAFRKSVLASVQQGRFSQERAAEVLTRAGDFLRLTTDAERQRLTSDADTVLTAHLGKEWRDAPGMSGLAVWLGGGDFSSAPLDLTTEE